MTNNFRTPEQVADQILGIIGTTAIDKSKLIEIIDSRDKEVSLKTFNSNEGVFQKREYSRFIS